MTTNIRRAAPVVAALMALSAACSTAAQTKTEKPRQYRLRGVVARIDPKTNVATIAGEKIPGWMDAMTMEYPVEDKKEYLALRKGEKITAVVNVSSEGYWLTSVKERKD
jgi:Cu/Ag efflux protein CusF